MIDKIQLNIMTGTQANIHPKLHMTRKRDYNLQVTSKKPKLKFSPYLNYKTSDHTPLPQEKKITQNCRSRSLSRIIPEPALRYSKLLL